ncbi:hypothetical protein HK104_006029 [Borealophlyctis nickersoniae]|nr:hypothetical protein HK104_006029 [Borealophlyctis nickersoniae]
MEVPPGAHTVSSTPIYPSLASLLPASLPPTPKRPADAAWVQPSGKKVKTLPSPTAEVEVSTPTESEVELMAARAPKSKSEKHSNSPQACPTERFAWLAKDYVKPPNADELKKLPTHKVALLMGYCGKEYTGMQL